MRKHSSWVLILASVVLVAVALATPVSAHHGWEDYQDEQCDMSGDSSAPVIAKCSS